MIRRLLVAALLALTIPLLTSCTNDSVLPRSHPAPPAQAWVSAISLYSNGAISRYSPVRVLFTNDVVPESRVGTDASANIAIEPRLRMHATFASRREIT